MASSYLQKRFSSLDTQMQTEINKTTADYQVRINQLENSRPKYEPSGQNIGGWILGAVILAFFTSGISLLVMGVILIGIKLMNNSKREQVAEQNRLLDGRVREMNRERDSKISEIKKRYAGKKAQEEASFKNKVKSARSKYAQKTSAKPIVDWLTDRFDKQIRALDRSPHIKQLSLTFTFQVNAGSVCTLKQISGYGSTPGSYGNADVFDLTKNLFTHLNDFEDRVGFAQAMAKFVQFEITKRFPKDPLAPSAVAPTVTITSDDDIMHLYYTVPNGKFRHATRL